MSDDNVDDECEEDDVENELSNEDKPDLTK